MELYLVNYRHKDSTPCKSITELPLDEAKNLAEKLHGGTDCRVAFIEAQLWNDRYLKENLKK